MVDIVIASYLGAALAWVLQDHTGMSFLMANMLAAPITVAAWTILSRAAHNA